MIEINCIQGTEEWRKIRLGIPTASNFNRIVTTKGEPSVQKQKFLYELAGERLTGMPMETYTNGNMERGKELEAQARATYELITGNTVEQVGFCMDDGRQFGCSPDGLVGEDGGVEIKCPTLPVAVEYLDKGVLPTAYCQQLQGQLLVTGREWWDFCAYFPGLSLFIIRVERDDIFLQKLEKALELFCVELNNIVKKLKG